LRYILLFTFIVTSVSVLGQEKRKVDLADILDEWVNTMDEKLVISDVHITTEKISESVKNFGYRGKSAAWKYLVMQYSDHLEIDKDDIIHVNKGLVFNNIEIGSFFFDNIAMTDLLFKNSNIGTFRLDSVILNQVELNKVSIDKGAYIAYSSIINRLYLNVSSPTFLISKSAIPEYAMITRSQLDVLTIDMNWSNKLSNNLVWRQDSVPWGVTNTPTISSLQFKEKYTNEDVITSESKAEFSIGGSEIGELTFTNNKLPLHKIRIYSSIKRIMLKDNILEIIDISEFSAFEQLTIEGNTLLTGVVINKLLSEVSFDIDWLDIKGKFMIGSDTLFRPTTLEVVSDMNKYKTLSSSYSSVYLFYKSIGLTSYANECYIEWKDMQSARYKYIYLKDGGFENFFRWKLNQLLKIYVNYGTSPARSILISIYIIIAFAVFYFFFPSEWDTTSKARLIANFKDFRQQNDKGYINPFFIMLGGFLLSLINAFTLSLNSFVTLGFGTIPTKGLARYVCIIQGFIGWFLLSIFTVSLINQVLI
jgi:hypothetical protein